MDEPTLEEVAQVIEAYVQRDSELKGGYFLVYDDQADKPLRLQLDKVHRERLSKIEDGLYFVCADFKTPEGTVYDLDFWMSGTSKQDLRVSDAIAVHKENGERRYLLVAQRGVESLGAATDYRGRKVHVVQGWSIPFFALTSGESRPSSQRISTP